MDRHVGQPLNLFLNRSRPRRLLRTNPQLFESTSSIVQSRNRDAELGFRIPKKWKWEGPLFTLKANDEEELIGTVVCTNASNPKPRGMRIRPTFDAMDRLNFVSFHDLSDIPTFLEACKTPDQFAILSASDRESLPRFKVIADYMAKHEKVPDFLIPCGRLLNT